MSAPVGKRAAAKAAMEEKLLGFAREAFLRDGYERVTFRGLAKAAGVSTGAFFAVWKGGKAELYQAATGKPAPDFPAFLERVYTCCNGYPGALQDLADDARELKRQLGG